MPFRDTGRDSESRGGLCVVCRPAYPLDLVAIVVTTQRACHISLAEWVDPVNVARALRHLATDHAVSPGATLCAAPACPVACELSGLPAETSLPPAVASSA